MKYAKINGTQIEWLSNDNALNYLDEKELNTDGFKEFVPAQYEQGKSYEWSYEETETQIIEHVKEIVPSPKDILKMAKESKIRENDELRDKALLDGVTYQNVLFDSDTDQKVNLLATVGMMSDTDTVVWYGMDNKGLLCTKADLMAIGQLITELHSFCWNNNAYIKEQINNAESIEEVENIEINYERG
jgi:hypothetical protein